MTATSETELRAPEVAGPGELLPRLVRSAEAVIVPLIALLAAAALFSIFLLILGKSPGAFFNLLWVGGFGTPFSWTNTLVRAGPLIFTALCVAIPARLGMVVIGGEGALVLGGFSAAAVAIPLLGWASPWLIMPVMMLAAIASGTVWIGLVGVLRHYRGVNETIASLLRSEEHT